MGSCNKFTVLFSASLLAFCTLATAADKPCAELLVPVELIKKDPKTFAFQGLTEEGLQKIKEARDVLRERNRLFQSELRNLDTAHHVGLVARLTKGNVFIYGPQGSAKSMLVNWIMGAERELLFKLQLHQMVTEQAFVGGQNFEAAKEGRFEVNTKGSLVDYAVALLDEFEKGNPATLSSLLSLLAEHEVLLGNQVVKARLETLFSTSNANLPEMFDYFFNAGASTTAAPLLNRFQHKVFNYNWLPMEDRAHLDQRAKRREYLSTLAESDPSVLADELFLEPQALDWVSLRHIAKIWFDTTPLFDTKSLEFTEDIRTRTNQAIRDSEIKHRSNRDDEPFVYFPSADWSERLRQRIRPIVVMSAFLDFLESPLADDESLNRLAQKQIQLDPLSLWRASLLMTTVGPGNAHLVFDPSASEKIDVDFGWTIDSSSARDKREEHMIKNLEDEQDRFRRTFKEHIKDLQTQIELSARNSLGRGGKGLGNTFGEESFELLLLKAKE